MNELRAPDLAAGDPATWQVSEDAFDPDAQLHSETVFTIGNGQLCVRGSFEEGYPGDHPAAFMHRVWDDMPVSVTELANLPRWWGVDLWFDGERFRLDTGRLLAFTRAPSTCAPASSAGPCAGRRPPAPSSSWGSSGSSTSPTPHRAAVRVSVASDRPVQVRTRAGLDAHVENTGLLHWRLVDQGADDAAAWLHTRTRTTAHRPGQRLHRDRSDGVEAHAGGRRHGRRPDRRARLRAARRRAGDADQARGDRLRRRRGRPGRPRRPGSRRDAAGRRLGRPARGQRHAPGGRPGTRSDVVIDGDPRGPAGRALQPVPAAHRRPAVHRATRASAPRPSVGLRLPAPRVLGHRDVHAAAVQLHPAGRSPATCWLYRCRTAWPARGPRRSATASPGAQFPWESAGTGDGGDAHLGARLRRPHAS